MKRYSFFCSSIDPNSDRLIFRNFAGDWGELSPSGEKTSLNEDDCEQMLANGQLVNCFNSDNLLAKDTTKYDVVFNRYIRVLDENNAMSNKGGVVLVFCLDYKLRKAHIFVSVCSMFANFNSRIGVASALRGSPRVICLDDLQDIVNYNRTSYEYSSFTVEWARYIISSNIFNRSGLSSVERAAADLFNKYETTVTTI